MDKLCLLLLFCISIFKAAGQPGSLDSTFGNNGIQTTTFLNNFNLSNEQGRVVLTSPTGDIFVVINIGTYTIIAKYLPGGKLDSSYGNAGYSDAMVLNITSAVLQGERIIVAGNALARYTANGLLDSSFGVNGKATSDFGATSIALQGDKIIVFGSSNDDFALARYTADGTLDSSYEVNGLLTGYFP